MLDRGEHLVEIVLPDDQVGIGGTGGTEAVADTAHDDGEGTGRCNLVPASHNDADGAVPAGHALVDDGGVDPGVVVGRAEIDVADGRSVGRGKMGG